MAWIYRVDQGRHPPEQNAVPTDRGKLSKAGWVRLRECPRHGPEDSAHEQAAAKPPWTGSRRPPQPDPPRQPPDSRPLTLTLIAAGAGLQALRKENHPTPASVVQSSLAHYDPAVRARRRAPVFLLSAPCAASANPRHPWSSNRAAAASSASPPTRPAARPRSSSRSTTSVRARRSRTAPSACW
ncbi:hypothetical protein G6F61_013364 [Rhizopus arrhizus]|nr:hypothetical protein G6F61_013364 [Rhizopus arrhizus]